MRPNIRTFIITTLGLLILAGGLVLERVYAQSPTPFQPLTGSANTSQTITVSGVGRASIAPDRVTVRLGVRTEADTASQALTENSAQMSAVLDALNNEGIASADIKTQTVQVYPRYQEQFQPVEAPRLAGYVAANIVEVRVRRVENLGALIDASVLAGANAVEGIRFEVSEQSGLYQQAREEAVQDALQKARHLASLVGAEIGQVIEVREEGSPMFFEQAGMGFGGAGAPVEPGVHEIQTIVYITWRLQ